LNAIDSSKTHKFYLLLKERINSGALSPGERLPSEPTLAASHGLSRVTVRRALDGLSREGLITRQAGAGTFVAMKKTAPKMVADLTDMLAHLAAMGRATKVKLLAFAYVTPPPPVAVALKLGPDERAQHAVRVRHLNGQPFSLLSTYVPERVGLTYDRVDLVTTPLLELLERSGVAVERAEQMISATLAGPDAAEALGVEIGAPLISLIRVVYGADGAGIEYLSAYYRPDMHAFHMEMMRTGRAQDRYWLPVPSATTKRSPVRRATAGKRTGGSTVPTPAARRRNTPARRHP